MIDGRSVIAIIPARAGSKGLPGKNLRPLCGKPLVAWSVESALRSRHVDEVLVSTDGEEIARVARAFGAAVPFLRPAELATDTATTLSAVEHALDAYAAGQGKSFDIVVLLEPTSPLREDDDIDVMLERLVRSWADLDSVITLGEVGEHPSIMKRLEGGRIAPYCPGLEQTTRRQDNPPAYFPYGVAYVVKTAVLRKERTFFAERCGHHLIRRYQNYEIDDMHDFVCVEAVMRHERGLA